VNATGTITVEAACAVGTASSTPTLTLNTALENITHTTTKVTGIGSASGLPEGVTAALASNTITISGTPSATGIFNYSIALTGSTCNNVIATGTITVTDVPPCGSTITYNDYPYKTVGIGTQCWMAENLRTRKYRDGTDIQFDASGGPTGDGQGQTWGALTSGAHTLYAHDSTATPSNLTSYGYLYNWYAVSDARGLCPTGWHVPTINEWTNLIDQLAGEIGSVSSLKAVGSKFWKGPNTANNSSGFSGLPGGWRFSNGQFRDIREFGFFWSSTEGESETAWYRYLDLDIWDRYIIRKSMTKKSVGGSVRCLKD
jgi:uncharacterized protein (TIGR02145 family)